MEDFLPSAHPHEELQGPTPPLCTFGSPLRVSQSGLSSSDVWDTIEELQAQVSALRRSSDRLERQVQRISHGQHCHCEHLAEVYADLEEYVDKTVPLHLRSPTSVPVASGVPLASSEQRQSITEAEILSIFANFREKIEEQDAALVTHVKTLEAAITNVRQLVEECQASIPTNFERVIKEAVDTAIKSHLVTQEHREKELRSSFDTRLGKAEKAVYKDMDHCVSSVVKLMERSVGDFIAAEEAKSKSNPLAVRVEGLHRCIDAVDMTVSKLMKEVADLKSSQCLEKEVEEETSEEASSDLMLELPAIRQELREHTDELGRIRAEGPWGGVFSEVKDWLMDLEKRITTRGEFLELKARTAYELSEIKRELRLLVTSKLSSNGGGAVPDILSNRE